MTNPNDLTEREKTIITLGLCLLLELHENGEDTPAVVPSRAEVQEVIERVTGAPYQPIASTLPSVVNEINGSVTGSVMQLGHVVGDVRF